MAEYISTVDGKYLIYRGKPLLREKNMICYGSMKDKYILFLMILSNKTIETADANKKHEVPDMILGQILSTDTAKPGHERIAKQFQKNGLHEAMDLGINFLDRMNA